MPVYHLLPIKCCIRVSLHVICMIDSPKTKPFSAVFPTVVQFLHIESSGTIWIILKITETAKMLVFRKILSLFDISHISETNVNAASNSRDVTIL